MLTRIVCDYASADCAIDYRVGVPVSRSYFVTHVQTCHSEGSDIAERRGEAAGFQAESPLIHLVQAAGATKYKTFQIPKRNGGQRTIKAPIDALKLLQRRLSDLLQNCVDEINTASQRKDRTAHGFKRKRSIITNARQHRHRRWVFNLDLEDFFPSINFGRVRGFLLKNRDFGLHEDVATVIAQIACHDNSLPQGSPCSPVISNLVAHLLDMRLVKIAGETGCTYSRYADDLTFSTNKKEFPADIAVPSGTEDSASHLWLPGEALQKDYRAHRLSHQREEDAPDVPNLAAGCNWPRRQ